MVGSLSRSTDRFVCVFVDARFECVCSRACGRGAARAGGKKSGVRATEDVPVDPPKKKGDRADMEPKIDLGHHVRLATVKSALQARAT